MPNLKYETVFDPSPESLAPIDKGLHEFNVALLGQEIIYNYHKVMVVARDGDGTLIGGVYGEMFWDWLHINTMWVDEEHRGHGIDQTIEAGREGGSFKGVLRGSFGDNGLPGAGLLFQERV